MMRVTIYLIKHNILIIKTMILQHVETIRPTQLNKIPSMEIYNSPKQYLK
jgi:hypothetical protein